MTVRSYHLGGMTALVAATLLASVTAHADPSGTLCTVGAFRSCNSIQLSTTAIYSGATRVGTSVTISMHNLNGQDAEDNTAWSGLTYAAFYSDNPLGPAFHLTSGPLSLGGGATGNATWWGVYLFSGPGGYGSFLEARTTSTTMEIGGCTPGSGSLYGVPRATTVFTCGPNATVSMTFTSPYSFDAASFGVLKVEAEGQLPGDPAIYRSNSVTPEPLTIVLLGTGLLGIGGVQLRRRKKHGTVDA
jgi:hypothetical protein